jgi:uncharacterized protein (UPF0218 family)
VSDIVLELPDSLRSELKDPLGPIFTDSEALLRDASEPIVSVGDVVTYHLIEAGHTPAVALVDERTERKSVRDDIADTIASYDGFDRTVTVSNPPATLGEQLLSALSTALAEAPATSTLIEVDGEEDLAALPAVMMTSLGTSLVYGQPGEGMVLATVDESLQADVRDILSRMDGDSDRFWDIINR